ncbi:hypothetical protein MUN77_11675 [Leucobacter allii]|uniref:hypothetical protein n=1 Tax=Leucobacter allii TaxID=2932247 RepID=UPI001FD1D67B|nr:hypothetical protein [Leucobacter allii]UOR00806.1 hypothetical protein MUN77_11675 [Leucobacter allii]
MASRRVRPLRIVLIAVLAIAVIALVGALVVALPILTHQSAGGSGQEIPQGTASHAEATGADGRTRELEVAAIDGGELDVAALVPGQAVEVRGSGFDASIGIYVAVCAIPESPGEKPSPCLGGIPEGAESGEADGEALTSAWVTDDWAWRAFATDRYDDAERGSFTVRFAVPPASGEGLDCRETRCAIATRADHTAGADRVQDMLLPVAFAE